MRTIQPRVMDDVEVGPARPTRPALRFFGQWLDASRLDGRALATGAARGLLRAVLRGG